MSFHVPEEYRLTTHPLFRSDSSYGNNGAFVIHQTNGRSLFIIASDATNWKEFGLTGIGWEHVSIHIVNNKKQFIPSWEEMCKIKDIFWDEEDVVIQYHPKKSEYINNNPYTLHLWRPVDFELPTPPKETVGI